MSRYLLRFAVAILSFTIGLFAVWASGYWSRFEDFVVEQLSNKSDELPTACGNESLPLKYAAERKAVYTQVLKEYIKDDTKALVVLYETMDSPSSVGQVLFSPLNLNSTDIFEPPAPHIKDDLLEVKNEPLKNYFSSLSPPALSDLPENLNVIRFGSKNTEILYRPVMVELFFSLREKPLSHISFYNIGFNSNLTRAFVNVSLSHLTYHESVYYLLRRDPDGWVIEKRVQTSAMYYCG